MADTPAPIELGFAEFTAKLISDVFEAVVAAQLAQEQQLAELAAAAELPLGDFADDFVADDIAAAELARLFPGPSPKQPTVIYSGAPYQPASEDEAEQPPVEAVLNLRFSRRDYTTRRQRTTLNDRGVDRIVSSVRQRLAVSQHAAVRELIRRGAPRVMADAGRVNSKLTYQVVTRDDDDEMPAIQPPQFLGQPLSGGAFVLPQRANLAKIHLTVRPADERAPQSQELKVNVFGEVEITFKTIV